MKFSLKTNSGDDREVKIVATWPEAVPELGITKGSPYDLSTVQNIWFTGKKLATDADSAAIIRKSLGSGITVSGNVATVSVGREDLVSVRPLVSSLTLVCDVQVKTATGKIWTVAEGKWTFTPEITQGE